MTTSINPTGHDHATGFPLFAPEAVLEVRTPAPETWTGAEWNAHVTAATSNRNGVPERLITCPTPVCTTTCPARHDETGTIPAEPDTTDRPVYRVNVPEVFGWADRTFTIPAPCSADEIATVVHAELVSVGYDSTSIDVDVDLAASTVRVTWCGDPLVASITGPGIDVTPAVPDTTPDQAAYVPLTEPVALLRNAVLSAVTRHGDAVYDYARALDASADERTRCREAVVAAQVEVQRLTLALAELAAQGGTR